MVILSVDDWVCIFVLSIVWMRHLAQGATRGWVMPGLVFKWFCFVSSHYLILPRVSSFGEGNGNPLQYFCLENPMDRGAW